jgi:asparagine synthase (glutamine-hydrolysing)
MLGRDGSSAIVFNGEIYNYIELRDELAKLGHTFATGTDTEVLLRMYEEFGDASLARLNGIFAFAIWDAKRQRLFCARDPLGIKPFYYHFSQDRLIFASEVKALLVTPWLEPAVDTLGLMDVLFSGAPQAGKTMFKGVQELPPGCSLVANGSGVKVQEYWDLEYRYDHGRSYEATAAEFQSLLQSAVGLQCRSDAPLGCHLSSGTDSTLISALASQHRPGLPTFTVRYGDGDKWDESELALVAAHAMGAEPFVQTPVHGDFIKNFVAAVWHMDAPLPNAGALSYRSVSELASATVKVTLTGHGGDEVCAGYPAQFQTAYGHTRPFADTGRPSRHTPALERLLHVVRRQGLSGLVRRVQNRVSARDPHEALWLSLHTSGSPRLANSLSPELLRRAGDYDPAEDYLLNFRQAPTDVLLDRCLYHDLRTYLPGLLMMEDRASMAFGVESRVPMLDVRIVEFLATVPPAQKTAEGTLSKRLLRDAARDLLPPSIVDRRVKAPFPAPFSEWLEGPLRDWAWNVLTDPRTLDRGVFHPDGLRERSLTAKEQWRALSVETWFRAFIDGDTDWMPA